MNRQRLVLLVLLIGFGGALVWSYRAMPRQKTVATPSARQQGNVPRPAVAAAGSAAPAEQARSLRIDVLDKQPATFKGYQRNLFRPVFVDEVTLMKQKAAAVKPLAPVKPVLPPLPATPPIQAAQPEGPQRELARFTFLGFMKKDNKKTIFLSKDKDIVLVRAGERFGGRYEASSITDQALTILVPDTGEQIVIPLVENKPLAAVRGK